MTDDQKAKNILLDRVCSTCNLVDSTECLDVREDGSHLSPYYRTKTCMKWTKNMVFPIARPDQKTKSGRIYPLKVLEEAFKNDI